MHRDRPLSENIKRLETDSYFITCAKWMPEPDFPSYEIGIRTKSEPDNFRLIQGNWRSADDCISAGNAIKLLLEDGWTPLTILRLF